MKNRRGLVLSGVAVAMLLILSSESSVAALRLRLPGQVCRQRENYTPVYNYGSVAAPYFNGTRIFNWGGNMGAVCPISTGPELVDLGDGSGHTLEKVTLRYQQINGPAILQGHLVLNDYDSSGSCTCGNDQDEVADNGWGMLSMSLDCGACSFDPSWGLNVWLDTHGSGGGAQTTIRLLSVYDTN